MTWKKLKGVFGDEYDSYVTKYFRLTPARKIVAKGEKNKYVVSIRYKEFKMPEFDSMEEAKEFCEFFAKGLLIKMKEQD